MVFFFRLRKNPFKRIRQLPVVALLASVIALAVLSSGIFLLIEALPLAYLKAPEPTYLVLDRQQRFVAELSSQPDLGYGYWPVTVWPERVINATLAREDRRFWQHPGVDFAAVGRALYQNFSTGRRISGASTIAMQIARMQNPGRRSYYNKAVESVTALLLTAKYERQEILRHYLRLIPYGNQVHGITYAAERYFSKPAEDLSWAEIAMLAAIPQSPTLNNPRKIGGMIRARARAEQILVELRVEGLISEQQYELAMIQLQGFSFAAPESRRSSAIHAIFKLQQQLQQDEKRTGFTKIQATFDLDIQQRVQDLASRYRQRWQINGADNVATIVVDTESREVLAWVGSSDYFAEHGGAIDYAQVPRSSGSTLKPFIYALALANKDISAATLLPDLASVSHGTSNSDGQFLGPMLPRLALANSRNVPAINLLRQVGLDNTYQFFQDIGLHQGLVPASHYGGGLAIGAMPVTLESLIEAYGVLANDGEFKPLRWYRQAAQVADEKILDRNIARQISLFLSDPQARLPSFPRMGTTEYSFPVALKTGTSQGYRDAWTLAYSKRYSVAVWVGRSDSRPMRQLGGAASAAQLVQTIMRELHKSRVATENLRFAIPEDYESVTLCTFTGKLANSQCHQSVSEWVDASELPPLDDSFESHWVDRRNGLLAGQWTPEQVLEKRQFVNLPAIYRSWGITKGLVSAPQAYSRFDNPDPNFNDRLGNEMQLRAKVLTGEAEIGIKILSPRNNLHVMKLPEVPAHLNSLAFNVEINSSVEQVLWYVDGKPYQTKTFPFTLRWPLDTGEHRFQAEIPYYGIRSNSVKVVVAE